MSNRGFAAIGLINPKTNANVGGALRAAHCFGASMVAVQGDRYKRQPTDTTTAYRHIPLIRQQNIYDAIPFDCVPVVIEIVEGAVDLREYVHPERAFYIFGPEDGSVPKAIVERARDVVYIPTAYCLNLAATVNVVLYDRAVKGGGNE
jgi:tRNA(Leu) C34 or U34 (ribose-2'-O)-methylase TrmL